MENIINTIITTHKTNEKGLKYIPMFDLHGYTKVQACQIVKNVILQCFELNISSIKFITGRGNHPNTNGERGVLFKNFKNWLKDDGIKSLIKTCKVGIGSYKVCLKVNRKDKKKMNKRKNKQVSMNVVNVKNESIKENNIFMTLTSEKQDFFSIETIKSDLDMSLFIKDTLLDRKESNSLIVKEETNLSLIRKDELRIPVVTEELGISVIKEKELKIPKITDKVLSISVDTEELNLSPFISQELVRNEESNMPLSYKVENKVSNYLNTIFNSRFKRNLNSKAQRILTFIVLICFKGVEMSHNPMKSFHWRLAAIIYYKLVKKFTPSKIFDIGCSLLERNEKVGIKLIQEAAENEYGEAQLYLGGAYIDGRIIERDFKKSFEWILKSARNNNIEAEFYLGCMYKFGIGCVKDYNKSLCWFIRSAKHHHSEAQFFLRYLYGFGQMVQFTQKDALKWFMVSAENGQVNAQYILGQIYEMGLLGSNKNELKSLMWYMESLKQGHSLARYRIGKITQPEINSQINSQQFTKKFFLKLVNISHLSICYKKIDLGRKLHNLVKDESLETSLIYSFIQPYLTVSKECLFVLFLFLIIFGVETLFVLCLLIQTSIFLMRNNNKLQFN